ncbi:hypothetical protein KSP40_PGU005016 [Platanthera guangdongensis]|uniref:Uncharacterized protein n=1 Tax=Platanthera guangdongensis TaxID=2320717 RepID=A0ABR2MF42_9ASPA
MTTIITKLNELAAILLVVTTQSTVHASNRSAWHGGGGREHGDGVEKVSTELAKVATKEKALVEECGGLLSQVQELQSRKIVILDFEVEIPPVVIDQCDYAQLIEATILKDSFDYYFGGRKEEDETISGPV